jgi:cation transport ATPase
MNKTYTFHVSGMHCNACVLMTESELGDLPHVTKVTSSLKNNSVEVTGDFGNKTPEQIANSLSAVLKKHGYSLSTEKQKKVKNWSDFKMAIPIAVAFAILFVLLQKTGLVNLVGAGNVTYGTAFVVGIIASLSTCMAVVGGLVLSMSATFANQENSKRDKVTIQLMLHGGRIISFFVLGGVIGAIGSAFTLSTSV